MSSVTRVAIDSSSLSGFLIQVSLGNVPGHSIVHKFGKNEDIDTGGFEDITDQGGSYTGFNATAAQTIEVFSSDAQDAGTLVSSGTATAGGAEGLTDTGATFSSDGVAVGDLLINDTAKSHGSIVGVTETTLSVHGFVAGDAFSAGDAYRVVTSAGTGSACMRLGHLLDGDYAESSEYVILNGVTGVDTTGTYLRNARMSSVLSGSNGTNVGIVTSRQKTTTANIFIKMFAGYGQSMVLAYTIPEGKTGWIVDWFAAVAGKTAGTNNVRLQYRPFGCSWHVMEEAAITTTGSSSIHRTYTALNGPFVERADGVIDADASANNMSVSGAFTLLLIDN